MIEEPSTTPTNPIAVARAIDPTALARSDRSACSSCGRPARHRCQACVAAFCESHWFKHAHKVGGPAAARDDRARPPRRPTEVWFAGAVTDAGGMAWGAGLVCGVAGEVAAAGGSCGPRPGASAAAAALFGLGAGLRAVLDERWHERPGFAGLLMLGDDAGAVAWLDAAADVPPALLPAFDRVLSLVAAVAGASPVAVQPVGADANRAARDRVRRECENAKGKGAA